MKKGEEIYVVEALRFGERESHTYLVGAYRTKKSAKLAAKAEEAWRGGKYECVITAVQFDVMPDIKLENLRQLA